MRSARGSQQDLTTRARIRDAAITVFGTDGFRSPTVRAIAASAGVSPALVIHHFGSKDGLREACDAHIIARIDEATADAANDLSPGGLVDQMARKPELAAFAPYLVKVLAEGGEFATRLFNRVVDDTEAYLNAAVRAGVVRPSTDDRARAVILATLSLGMQMLAQYLVPPDTPRERVLIDIYHRFTRPAMELLTHGLFTGTDYLDAFDALNDLSDLGDLGDLGESRSHPEQTSIGANTAETAAQKGA